MGGGGDDGYEKRQQGIEQSKAQARAKLNAMFGAVTDPAALGLPSDPKDAYFREKMNLNPSTPLLVPDEVASQDPGYGQFMEGMNNRLNDVSTTTAQNAQARDGLYQTVRDNAFTAGKRALDEKQQDAARKLKFELFATGQAGGSGDIDENAKQKRTYNQGLIDLGREGGLGEGGLSQRRRGHAAAAAAVHRQRHGPGLGSVDRHPAHADRGRQGGGRCERHGRGRPVQHRVGVLQRLAVRQGAAGRAAAGVPDVPAATRHGVKRNAATTGVTTRLPGE
jgi:hypothetical protein